MGCSPEDAMARRRELSEKETEFLRLKRSRLGKQDFDTLKVIGRGAFGEACPARSRGPARRRPCKRRDAG